MTIFYSFSCSITFLIIVFIRVHFDLKPTNWVIAILEVSSFNLPITFLFALSKYGIFRIVAIVKFILIIPKILMNIFNFNFICQRDCLWIIILLCHQTSLQYNYNENRTLTSRKDQEYTYLHMPAFLKWLILVHLNVWYGNIVNIDHLHFWGLSNLLWNF